MINFDLYLVSESFVSGTAYRRFVLYTAAWHVRIVYLISLRRGERLSSRVVSIWLNCLRGHLLRRAEKVDVAAGHVQTDTWRLCSGPWRGRRRRDVTGRSRVSAQIARLAHLVIPGTASWPTSRDLSRWTKSLQEQLTIVVDSEDGSLNASN